MRKLIVTLSFLTILFTSCTKEEFIFKKVDVQQQGELVRVSGYIPEPLTYEFAYSVRVKFCNNQYVDMLVTIPAGQVNGYRDYVTDETVQCRFESYEIQWQTNLIQ